MKNYNELTKGNGNWINVFCAFLGDKIVKSSITLDQIDALAKNDPAYKSVYQYRRMHQVFAG